MTKPPLIERVLGIVAKDVLGLPGMVELVDAGDDVLHDIVNVPGTMRMERSGRIFFNIPRNFFELGQRGGTISEYAPDMTAPRTPVGQLPLDEDQLRMVTLFRNVSRDWEGASLAADAGTGKTLPTLHALWLDGYLQGPGLVCAPAGATTTWCDPIASDPIVHYGLQIKELHGENAQLEQLSSGGWFFCNYDILHAWSPAIKYELKPKVIVFDEIHELSNLAGSHRGSRRAWAAQQLSKMFFVERRYGLTGTPIKKSRVDLHGQMAIVQPRQWGQRHDFGMRYMGLEPTMLDNGKRVWKETRPTNVDELRARLAGCFLRYKKRNVPGMPQLIRKKIPIRLPEQYFDKYFEVTKDPIGFLEREGRIKKGETAKLGSLTINLSSSGDGYKKAADLIRTSLQREILSEGKSSLIPDIVAGELSSLHANIVVFCWMRREAKAIAAALRKKLAGRSVQVFGSIDGSDVVWKRQNTIREFVSVKPSILVCTRDSVKISINEMAQADACIQTQADWNPSAILQTEGRLHRKCCPHKEVYSYYPMVENSLDDKVLELLWAKAEEAQDVSPQDVDGLHLAASLDEDEGVSDDMSFEEIGSVIDIDSDDPYRLTKGY